MGGGHRGPGRQLIGIVRRRHHDLDARGRHRDMRAAHRLRKKLEVGGVRIATVRGLGYCMEKFVEPPAGATHSG